MEMSEQALNELRNNAAGAADFLKALANPDRLILLCQLLEGEYCVSDLEQKVGLYQPSLSQQLGILREQGLVKSRREGRQMYYQMADGPAVAILQTLYQHFCKKENEQ